jgi:hypothetical protein
MRIGGNHGRHTHGLPHYKGDDRHDRASFLSSEFHVFGEWDYRTEITIYLADWRFQREGRMGTMGKGFILWLLGVPVSVLAILWFLGILR